MRESGVTGHVFQSRYGSVVMDEDHLLAAARYVALNPVRARLASRAQDWRWSSVRAHLVGRDDGLAIVAPMLERCNGRFGDPIDAARRGLARRGNDRPPARIARLPGSPRGAHGARSEATQAGTETDH